ncbi:MAG: sigma-70 family RNA polymerase sigma factor [Verrucomicrobiia bacterium]
MGEISQSPAAVAPGAGRTTEELFPLVYEELRRLAAGKLACERPGQTLQPTALVHEAWLRLSGSSSQSWEGRTHFFGAAAEAMRRILVDNARRKLRLKHGAGVRPLQLEEMDLAGPLPDPDLVALDEGLTQLAQFDQEAADLVNLRFFGGLTQAQAAEQLNISRSSADRSWVFARAWLYHYLRPADPLGGNEPSSRPIS